MVNSTEKKLPFLSKFEKPKILGLKYNNYVLVLNIYQLKNKNILNLILK